MKPHWKDSPSWARWLAQDKGGDWFWFETEPNAHRTLGFWCVGPGFGRVEWARKSPLIQPWTDSKERYAG